MVTIKNEHLAYIMILGIFAFLGYSVLIDMRTDYRYITETSTIIIDKVWHNVHFDVYRIDYRTVHIISVFNISTSLYDVSFEPYGVDEFITFRRNDIEKKFIVGNVYMVIYLPYQKGIREVSVLLVMGKLVS